MNKEPDRKQRKENLRKFSPQKQISEIHYIISMQSLLLEFIPYKK